MLTTRRTTGNTRRTMLIRSVALALLCLVLASSQGTAAPGSDLDDLPDPTKFVTSGAVTNTQIVAARRSKTYISVGPDNPIWGLLHYGEWNACGTGRNAKACPIGQPAESYSAKVRVGWPFKPLPATCVPTAPPEETTQYVRSKLVLVSTRPRDTADGRVYPLDRVGDFPEIRVNLVAFGSIPVTATLRMSMTKRGMRTTPWTVHVWNPIGYRVDPVGCPNPSEYYRTLIEGQVDLRLSDLRVDGQLIALGPSCRTVQPVDIDLWGETGYFALQGGFLSQREDLEKGTGTVIPLHTPGYPEVNASLYQEDEGRMLPDSTGVDIPPFTGCGVGDESLDPLVTAMASGPNNPLRVAQGTPMSNGYDLSDLSRCDRPGACPLPAPELPEPPPLPEEDQ